jgi:hypothetical protein
MSPISVPDLPIQPQYVKNGHQVGAGRWANRSGLNDRIGYHTTVPFWEHEDPGHHPFVPVLRFMFQAYGARNVGMIDTRMIEDPFGDGSGNQGFPPYPYELEKPLPVDRSRSGAVVEVFHQRLQIHQLLQRITIPEMDPAQPKTQWYYQLNGLVVAVNEEFVTEENPDGAIAKLIISTMHGAGGTTPAYKYQIQGVNTA